MRKIKFCVFVLSSSFPIGFAFGQPATPEPSILNPPQAVTPAALPPGDKTEDVETLLRGPIHEAFAEPLQPNAQPNDVVPKEPPKAVEEVPPEVTMDDAIWIAGYWAWDDDRQDFIWVSGVWRRVPQGRNWVSGEWIKAEGGYRWVSGYWTVPRNAQVQLLPEPPQTIEEGPTSVAPSENHFWVPGGWQYRETRYVWRPGFWTPCQENWLWTPEHYVWRPGGCAFVPGFWDYHWNYRGTLFAPSYFHNHLAYGAAYHYRPSVVIHFGNVLDNLWVRPHHGHYYFGDYYGDSYVGLGFTPWHNYHSHSHFYDPLFVYHHWSHRDRFHNFHDFHRDFDHRHRHLHDHADERPHRTFHEYEHQVAKNKATRNTDAVVRAERVEDFVRANKQHRYLDKVNGNQVLSTRELKNAPRQQSRGDLTGANRGDLNRQRNRIAGDGQGVVTNGQNINAPPPSRDILSNRSGEAKRIEDALQRDTSSKLRNRLRQLEQGQQRSAGRQIVPSPHQTIVPDSGGSIRSDGNASARIREFSNPTNVNPRSVPQAPSGRRGRTFNSEIMNQPSGASSTFQGNDRARSLDRGSRIQATPRTIQPDSGFRSNSPRGTPNSNIESRQPGRSAQGFSSSEMKRSRNQGEVQSMRRSMQEHSGGGRRGKN